MNTQTKKRNKVFNVIMAALIAVIAFCGIMAVGSVKGWFGGDSDSDIVTSKITGVANIERSGVGYSLKEDVALKVDDIAETKNGSEAELTISDENQLVMNEGTQVKVTANQRNDIGLSLDDGEFFADVPEAGDSFSVAFDKNTAHVTGTVFSVSVQQGSSSINVYEGTVQVDVEDGSQQQVKAGESLSIAHDTEGNLSATVNPMEANSLSDFLIEKALACEDSDKLCFTADELNKITDTRTAEKAQAEQEAAEQAEEISAELEADGDSSGDSGSTAAASAKSGKSSSKSSSSKSVKSCTISIRCDTILNNMGDLAAGKNRYVPSNGVILASSRVEFADGETVFDVLKRVCSATGIQLEYSYTPMYGSYYIEGINNLYEFDCGSQSGWMYKVNGWFPNYGCSSYTLKNGDNIVWCYTCKGLGADVGGAVY